MNPPCKICGSETDFFDKARILGKYDISYYSCPCCGFIQTEEPYWLDEAYSDAITQSDIGLCSRNIALSKSCDALFRVLFNGKHGFIDYGGGYGMFVRLMRDRGYDFEWYDEYCTNIFAMGHEKSKVHYDVLTSFEMFEHLVNPLETIQALSSLADTIVFSTALVPKGRPKTNEWWYFCLDHGQHVAFYTKESLRICAGKIGMNYYNLGNLHIMTKVKLPELKLHVLSNNRIRYLLSFVFPRRRSLLGDDYISLKGKQF